MKKSILDVNQLTGEDLQMYRIGLLRAHRFDGFRIGSILRQLHNSGYRHSYKVIGAHTEEQARAASENDVRKILRDADRSGHLWVRLSENPNVVYFNRTGGAGIAYQAMISREEILRGVLRTILPYSMYSHHGGTGH